MSKFPNHCILKLFQKFRENFFQNFLSENWPLYMYDYFPDIYWKVLITQLFLKIFPEYKKTFIKITCFQSFLRVHSNFLKISEHMSIFTNVDIHTLVRESSITRQDIPDILVSFDSGLIYQHVSESFHMRREQVKSVENETTTLHILILVLSRTVSTRM